ncbi:sulfide:quinone oxidoreductase [Sphingomonas laterariae]|uniref:Sulfide:quinone oxidoreductase n=1 Tax=Edaphosphingomonas laterariae TaxID=861865 RepID=A0A239FIC8_9SPHN|nr:bifunctional protein tyrosine phosphatase family protein/NAD(P)/FAD-dependent oxidoreductase [Sphingomonas laterariae]SNS55814.1 sulfide:quinone oxidoreductase [Sphingomonas laterariae]
MDIKPLTPRLSVAAQLLPQDVQRIAQAGFRTIICNRPDGESADQPVAADIRAAADAAGLAFVHIPAVAGALTDADTAAMRSALDSCPAPALAYCRSGARAEALARMAGAVDADAARYDIVIVGGGSAGMATAASILKRRRGIRLAIVEPSDVHYYQPGWTMVGAGVFNSSVTRRKQAGLIPKGARWIKASAVQFCPDDKQVILSDGRHISYAVLIVCPGLKLDWDAIPGLAETLGRNGVTSNYRYDLAPYTHRLAREFQGGRALFTQPVMPIKCAGAPQKAMYLSCHRWEKSGILARSNVQFHSAGAALFGVPDYIPALMEYVDRYGIHLNFGSKLVAVDGAARTAIFQQSDSEGTRQIAERFDMIHVVPPQIAPDFIRSSPLAAASGFVEVDEATLRHPRHPEIFALGDACATSNAKTAAAARKQAPVVAVNALAALDGRPPVAAYDGYGSCPLTVEAGRIVLAEFGYGGKLLPSFPRWLIDGTRPSRLSWLLKDSILPPVYWHGMLKGREWMVRPQPIGTSLQS